MGRPIPPLPHQLLEVIQVPSEGARAEETTIEDMKGTDRMDEDMEDKDMKGKDNGIWDKEMKIRVLRAQLHAVNVLAYDLSTRPCLFIIKKLKRRFVNVYLKHRLRYATVTVGLFVLAWTLLIPSLAARALVPVECGRSSIRIMEATFTSTTNQSVDLQVDEITAQLEFERSDCEVFHFLRNQLWMLLPGSCMLLLVLIAFCILRHPSFQRLNTQIAYWIKPLIPKVYMSGLGPSNHPRDSAFNLMSRAGLKRSYSWMHDFLGSAERARLIFLVGVVNLLSCGAISFCTTWRLYFWEDGHLERERSLQHRLSSVSAGIVSGTAASWFAMRITFFVMNEVLAPSAFLRKAIENELQTHQPLKHVLKGCLRKVDSDKLRGAVESAEEMLRNCEGPLLDDKKKLINEIHEKGEALLEAIAMWLSSKYFIELTTDKGPLFELFRCMREFACTEHELAALTFLDPKVFLLAFFDPDWKVMGKISHLYGSPLKFSKCLLLKHVYVSNPDVKICTQNAKGFWEVEWVGFDISAEGVDESFKRCGGYGVSQSGSIKGSPRGSIRYEAGASDFLV